MAESVFNSLSIGPLTFLGGVTVTALVLVIQIEHLYAYSEILITLMSTVSLFFILATWGTIHLASNQESIETSFGKFIGICKISGFFGIIGILPLIIYPFSQNGSFILIGLEAVLIIILLTTFYKSHK